MTTTPQKLTIARTLLCSRPKFVAYTELMDKIVLHRATYSYEEFDTMDTIDRIVRDMSKKDTIAHLDESVDKAMENITPGMRELLTDHYLGGVTLRQLAADRSSSERTISRNLQFALEQFSTELQGADINVSTFNHLLRTFPWIRSEYKKQLAMQHFQEASKQDTKSENPLETPSNPPTPFSRKTRPAPKNCSSPQSPCAS